MRRRRTGTKRVGNAREVDPIARAYRDGYAQGAKNATIWFVLLFLMFVLMGIAGSIERGTIVP